MSWKERFSEIGEKASSYLGYSVSVSGNYAVVGANVYESYTGKAYWYERQNDGKWKQVHSVIGEKASSQFGIFTVSISGNYAVVGASNYESYTEGKAYWYERQNDGKWKEVHSVVGEKANSSFGFSVSISGNYAVVGAYGYDALALTQMKVKLIGMKDKMMVNGKKSIVLSEKKLVIIQFGIFCISKWQLCRCWRKCLRRSYTGKAYEGKAYWYERQNDGKWKEVHSVVGEKAE